MVFHSNRDRLFATSNTSIIIMKSRSFKLIVGLLGSALAICFATAYAWSAHQPNPSIVIKSKNELVFNWGLGS
jgi:hypothetical protein